MAVTEAVFARMADQGAFELAWKSHGLRYGIPASSLEPGKRIVLNVSRTVIGQARAQVPGTVVVLVTAARDTLRARLSARGRETPEDVEARLDRAGLMAEALAPDRVIHNDGAVEAAVAAMVDIIRAA